MGNQELTQLESRIQALKASHAALTGGDALDELLKIIHRPGWITPAEVAFVRTSLATISAQTKQLNSLTQGLLTGAKLAGTSRAAGA